jgi:Peptidase family M28/PA domain
LLATSVALSLHAQQQHPRDFEIHDADTKAWWHTTEALSGDDMEGRDTGSAAYQRAADYVAKRFANAGLKPAGDGGTYFQTVPMHEIAVKAEGTSFTLKIGESDELGMGLKFLEEITVSFADVPPVDTVGAVVFRGYCGKDAVKDVAGKVVMCFGTQRTGLPSGTERAANVRAAGAVGIVNVDDPYFTIEPPRWPFAYARSVTLRDGAAKRSGGTPFLVMRCSAGAFTKLLQGAGHDAAAILKTGGAKEALESFDLPGYTLHAHVVTAERDISSPNVLAVLPGSDPVLKDQYVVVAAHLDGYGFGTPVKGDGLYNGALDDAAYLALLVQMADDLRDGRERGAVEQMGVRTGQYAGVTLGAPKRSILFCAFTGEEKGLLGSNWFVGHPTVPLAAMAGNINLDQLRPLFPLTILTAEAIDETTLGATAKAVGAGMGIELRPDREPERNLLRRADQFPFLKAGVPAISFVFGFDPGTDSEKKYREWYEVRYHRPQDDLTQPMDFGAATKFNAFFYRLVETVADAPERPAFLAGSQFKSVAH